MRVNVLPLLAAGEGGHRRAPGGPDAAPHALPGAAPHAQVPVRVPPPPAVPAPVPQVAARVYVFANNGKKFHRLHCGMIRRGMRDGKLIVNMTDIEAMNRGLLPCRQCRP